MDSKTFTKALNSKERHFWLNKKTNEILNLTFAEVCLIVLGINGFKAEDFVEIEKTKAMEILYGQKKKKINPFEGKALVPKIGHEAEFKERLAIIIETADGLGYADLAKMMVAAGAAKHFNIKAKGKKLQEKVEALLKDMMYQHLMEVAEWVTKEEAEKRAVVQKILYSKE